ncbi:nicotinate phosphoribosyltransferase [Streptomyces fragilis]|uniref:Nicotinate phosphoribosyltransferase n=1 Tax=Streptomyces fragilis TaxID=67301 RepID=A0ABV2YGM6_9ACTN|nr:nicotinate phosphoribosyltransferase [Streptomyces fragilis]
MPDATNTDLYEITMAMCYRRERMGGTATFDLFVRDLPAERGFLVAAGVESALDLLEGFRIGEEETEAFAAALGRPRQDLEPLRDLTFTGEAKAVPEGRIVLAGEPLMEVTAPITEAQLVETCLLNRISHQTAIASKAARCVLAAAGRPVVDFSLRRTHGAQAGHQAARLGALVGFAGTSNVAAAVREGIPAVGTMAHSFVEAFPTEEDAFRAFARCHPGPLTLLVDTYDTERGVQVAARVLRDLDRAEGSAVRLDSGDLGALAVRARALLDAAGLPGVRVVASGGLDEYALDALVRAGAPVDLFAVGTRVGVSADAPSLDSAYKLVEYDGRPVMKLSQHKVTAPGAKQVHRRPDFADVIGLAGEAPPEDGVPLLETVMRHGRRTAPRPSLADLNARFTADLAALPASARRIRAPLAPRAVPSQQLERLTGRVRARTEKAAAAATGDPTRPHGHA